jgi:outer membrane protein assembly factor BamB
MVDLDGTIVRSLSLPGRAVASPARAQNGSLWVATADGDLVEIVHESRIRRTVTLGARLGDGTTIAIAPSGDLVVAVPTRGLVCIAPDGSERWTATVSAPFFGFLAVDPDGRVAALDRLSRLSAVSPDGVVEWSVNLGAVPLAAPVVLSDHSIAVATDHGLAMLSSGAP